MARHVTSVKTEPLQHLTSYLPTLAGEQREGTLHDDGIDHHEPAKQHA